jgi:hypothetical protein
MLHKKINYFFVGAKATIRKLRFLVFRAKRGTVKPWFYFCSAFLRQARTRRRTEIEQDK